VGNKKAVTTALGRNPAVKTKGEGMSNGSNLSLPTATTPLYNGFQGHAIPIMA
jgi:hypothetical protein